MWRSDILISLLKFGTTQNRSVASIEIRVNPVSDLLRTPFISDEHNSSRFSIKRVELILRYITCVCVRVDGTECSTVWEAPDKINGSQLNRQRLENKSLETRIAYEKNLIIRQPFRVLNSLIFVVQVSFRAETIPFFITFSPLGAWVNSTKKTMMMKKKKEKTFASKHAASVEFKMQWSLDAFAENVHCGVVD